MNSKNKRKYRVWDNKLLFQTYEQCIQIKTKIEDKCDESTGPEHLPPSLIPTDSLYELVACYESMYEKLLEEELLVCGYPKSTKSYH